MFTAGEAAVIKRFINSFQVRFWNGREPFVDRSNAYGEYTIYMPRSSGGSAAITSTFDFALAYDAETDVSTCTISPGEVRMHGLRTYKLTEPAPVVLTGTIACVHLVIDRASPSAPLTVASDLIAETDGANMRLPLYTFEKKGASYALKASHHRGDFDFAAPIR
jgi:hypothetical protein